MKKYKNILFIYIFLIVCLSGCVRTPLCISFISNSTQVTNGFKVVFADDELYKDKSYDIYVLSEDENVEFVFWEELGEKRTISIPNKDEWYSLTTLAFIDQADTEDFITYSEATALTLNFESEKDIKLKFKGVVGDEVSNANKTGYILTNKVDTSKIYSFNINAKK